MLTKVGFTVSRFSRLPETIKALVKDRFFYYMNFQWKIADTHIIHIKRAKISITQGFGTLIFYYEIILMKNFTNWVTILSCIHFTKSFMYS